MAWEECQVVLRLEPSMVGGGGGRMRGAWEAWEAWEACQAALRLEPWDIMPRSPAPSPPPLSHQEYPLPHPRPSPSSYLNPREPFQNFHDLLIIILILISVTNRSNILINATRTPCGTVHGLDEYY